MVVPDLLYERELAEHNGRHLQALGLGVVSLTPAELALAQAVHTERKALSLADCFALSCATRLDHTLVTGDKALRSEHLRKILTPEVRLHERIRDHWIVETGYSFPSGHSFASMMLATFFMAMGLTYFSGRRLWVFYVLVVWAVAVCISRPLLRVHSPTDVCAGGIESIVAGALAYLFVRWILVVLPPVTPLAAQRPPT